MDSNLLLTIVGVVFTGAAATIATAISQRRKVGADATAVVTAAARELVDPLRKELATERADRAVEVEVERRNLMQVRSELAAAMDEARALRVELSAARREMDSLRAENARFRARIRDLESRR